MSDPESIFPAGMCPPPNIADSASRVERVTPPPLSHPSNVVAWTGTRLEWNNQNVRVAMTEKRIRIGCTEISVEAARNVMRQHALRFGKPVEEIWQEVQ